MWLRGDCSQPASGYASDVQHSDRSLLATTTLFSQFSQVLSQQDSILKHNHAVQANEKDIRDETFLVYLKIVFTF